MKCDKCKLEKRDVQEYHLETIHSGDTNTRFNLCNKCIDKLFLFVEGKGKKE